MFSRRKKKKDDNKNNNNQSKDVKISETKEEKGQEIQSTEESKLTTHQEGKTEIEEEVAVVAARREIPVNPYSSPYPFSECQPKVLTAYASSVYNANEGRLLTIEMEKVSTQLIINQYHSTPLDFRSVDTMMTDLSHLALRC
jgi:hypothetical protein